MIKALGLLLILTIIATAAPAFAATTVSSNWNDGGNWNQRNYASSNAAAQFKNGLGVSQNIADQLSDLPVYIHSAPYTSPTTEQRDETNSVFDTVRVGMNFKFD